jgi:hypothetical protein
MTKVPMKVDVRKVPDHPHLFEFTIATPMLRSQFRLPRKVVNQLRIILEKALVGKP